MSKSKKASAAARAQNNVQNDAKGPAKDRGTKGPNAPAVAAAAAPSGPVVAAKPAPVTAPATKPAAAPQTPVQPAAATPSAAKPAAATPTPAKPAAATPPARKPSPNEVSARAHQIWIDAGRPEGQALAHWFRAERELTK